MRRDYSAPTSDNAPHCTCDATTSPTTAQEHHHHTCAVFDSSRGRRDQDLAALADHPDGHVVIRPIDDSEVAEIADAVGRRVPTGAGRARWTVAVMQAHDDHAVALARAVLIDGQPVAALVDETPAANR